MSIFDSAARAVAAMEADAAPEGERCEASEVAEAHRANRDPLRQAAPEASADDDPLLDLLRRIAFEDKRLGRVTYVDLAALAALRNSLAEAKKKEFRPFCVELLECVLWRFASALLGVGAEQRDGWMLGR